ncbi:MAG: class I adenylate-forming enzyme family protein [Haloarculaceae archaeon]
MRWPNATIYRGLAEVAAERPEATALVFEDESWSYEELLDRSRALAGGLAELGVGPGDTVAVWLGNRPEWIQTQLAASYLGAAIVAVNTRYRTHELAYMLGDADCRVLVTESSFLDNDYLEMLAEVVPSVRTSDPDAFDPADLALREVVAVDGGEEFAAARDFGALEWASDPPAEPANDNEAPATVFYTSGTTGDPKGCLQPARSVLNHSYNGGAHLGVDETDVVLGVLPFPGVWGYNTWLLALARGATLVVQSHYDPTETARLLREEAVTYFPGLAVMFTRLLDSEAFTPTDAVSLDRGVVGFLTLSYDEATFERIEEAFGFPAVQPYGLSEGNSQVFVGRPDDPMAERTRIGGPLVSDEQEARVVDPETGDDVDDGEKGELLLRGYNVMNGYLGKPEATAEAIDGDGWLHTGDLCSRERVTVDGASEDYLTFHSRLDDALRVRGFLVSPREIEVAVDGVEGVAQSQVVGVPHEEHGQVPVAFVRRSDPDLDAGALRDALADQVADYKLPATVEFVESFPRTESPHGEKIQKHELRERARDLT